NVHVHHIDNSAGHQHAVLVDTKPGTENVTVEYCTDGGGSWSSVDWDTSSLILKGHRCTVRWNRLQDGHGNGLKIGREFTDSAPDDEFRDKVATENEIYGNEILGFDDDAVSFYPGSEAGQGPEHQAVYCGNTVEGRATGEPEGACSENVPTTDRVGHVGGNSPWTGKSLPESTGPGEIDRSDDEGPEPDFSVSGGLESETATVGDRRRDRGNRGRTEAGDRLRRFGGDDGGPNQPRPESWDVHVHTQRRGGRGSDRRVGRRVVGNPT
ncbi:hypothetical protein BRC84_00780, partial [Halobacteriales archaeon QS_1_68_44]